MARMFRRFVAVVLSASCAFAIFRPASLAPVDRILENTAAYVKQNPDKPDGYYALARTHYLAYSLSVRELEYFGTVPGAPFNGFSPGHARQNSRLKRVPPMTAAERQQHYDEAVRNFRRALELSPKNALYTLGLASLQEDHGDQEQAIASYLAAFNGALPEDEKSIHVGPAGLSAFVTHEAGTSYIRMIDARGRKPGEDRNVARMRALIAKLEKLPRAITPVVLSLNANENSTLRDMLDPRREVTFDLDGTGRAQRYSWLKADTAFLVWDPERTGAVTSGLQLFGSVTWWLFWENGYRALAALDDNRDGKLAGPELRGLALWFDRNQNGRSDPGEVVPMENTEIESIAVAPNENEGDSLVSRNGLQMKDGRQLPTWDWTAKSIPLPLIGRHILTEARP